MAQYENFFNSGEYEYEYEERDMTGVTVTTDDYQDALDDMMCLGGARLVCFAIETEDSVEICFGCRQRNEGLMPDHQLLFSVGPYFEPDAGDIKEEVEGKLADAMMQVRAGKF